jgi:hypothetical protein
MGDYKRVISAAEAHLKLSPEKPVFQYHIFCAQTALGEYDKATALFSQIISPGYEARSKFHGWCGKYIFDTLEAGRSWHPPDHKPEGAAFLPMVEAEETYRRFSVKAKRIITDGFTARWSPDRTKLAFSMGVVGYNGVAIYEFATKETELLIVPGKDPIWSPDGRYITFVRDCQVLRIPEFATAGRRSQLRPRTEEEIWVMKSDGREPRRMAVGGWPSWSQDSTCVYYHSRLDKALCSISILGLGAKPKKVMACTNHFPSVSPDNQRVAYQEGSCMKVIDIASQALIAEWPAPYSAAGGPPWSPTGDELCMGGQGLWIYRFDQAEPIRMLDGPIMGVGSWAPDGTKLVFHLVRPYYEIWVADLDPSVPTIEALDSGRVLKEHSAEKLVEGDWREGMNFTDRRKETNDVRLKKYEK